MSLSNLAHQTLAEEPKPGVTGNAVPLGTRVDMYPGSPLPELNAPGGPAFAARLKGDAGSDLMAIVCNSGLPTRLDVMSSLRSVDHPSMMRIIDNGVVTMPDGARYMAFAWLRPLAPRLMHSLDEVHAPPNEDIVNRHFVQPLIGALTELMRTSVVHGAIRSTNVFWRPGSAAPPQLGPCLSAPAGVGQPALFETIERGMSPPLGRGPGMHVDDCYAFGIVLALLVLGHNPLKGLDDNAVVRAKMEHGTFNAIVGRHRLSPTHIELLRGLLADDAHQRWTAADLEQWLSGRRLTPKSSDVGRHSSRHFDFAGKEYWQVRPLATALAGHVYEAMRAVDGSTLDKWLRRSLGDEDRADNVAEAIDSLKKNGKIANYEDQLIARICIALDPSAPIRYRGLSIMPAGIAGMMAQAVVSGGNVSVIAEIIASQLVTFWVEMQKQMKTELVPLVQQFERLTGIIEKTTYGSGVEHALYELNPALPCLSPMLRAQYVMTSKALLPALERVASEPGRPSEPMDRHIAAFLIARDRRSELLLESMNAPENSPRRSLAMLTLYSEMQNRHGPESLPHLAQWLLPLLEPATLRYFGKGVRDHLHKQMREAAERGNLAALAKIIDNPQRLQRDEQEFVAARLLYFNILKEINTLEGRVAGRDAVVADTGKPLAATISSLVALIAVLAAVGRVVWTSF